MLNSFGNAAAADAAFAFFKTQGIILRPMAEYGLGHCLRVTVGTDEEMGLVLAALDRFLKRPCA